MAVFVLVHSPLAGPLTWSLVANELRRSGYQALTPALPDTEPADRPYWQHHARAVVDAMSALPADESPILVGHSGAGPLLPAIRYLSGRPVAAYLSVDAGIPRDGKSRLDLWRAESPESADQLHGVLSSGGRWPEWTGEMLRDIIPDPELRKGTLAELRPQPLAFWTEPIPVFDGWPDAPCGYIQFTSAYDVPAAQARRLGG